MNATNKLMLVASLSLLPGCGMVLNLPNRNGEYYLASQTDCKAIAVTYDHSPYAWFTPGPILAIPWIICWGVDFPFSLVTDTLLIPFDFVQGRRKGLYIAVVDDEGKPVPDASIKGYCRRRVNGTTDDLGFFRWAIDSRSIEWYTISKSGYYDAQQQPRGGATVTAELAASHTNVLSVLLKRIRNPIPMYAKRACVDLPALAGTYSYDLIIGDLVTPHGTGRFADFVFNVRIGPKLQNLHFEVSFSSTTDGIQRYDASRERGNDAPRQRQSTFIFPYETPSNGYRASLSDADDAVDVGRSDGDREKNRYYNGTYLFKIRSDNTTNGMYGLIYGLQAGAYGKTFPTVEFTYYLNPTGTRNLEYDSGRNLIKSRDLYRYRHQETRPRAK